MIINYSYHEEFTRDFDILRGQRCAESLLTLDGIGSQLDVNEFSRNFFSKKGATTADVSVDANSNVDIASAMQYHNELAKPLHRLNAYYLLWKYARQLYHSDIAYKMIEAQFKKAIYINDFHTFGTISYCFNFSCMDVMFQGLPFVRKIRSSPLKHLSSFMGQLVQFVTYASNSIAGAVGLADMLICASYFVDKMFDTNKEVPVSYLEQQVKQELQSFIYSVNQPFRGSVQSPFTNVSIYDRTFLTKLCSEYVFPDGTSPSVASVQRLQGIFVDLMNETLRVTPCTFPVTTACFAIDDAGQIMDEEFLDFVTEKNMEFGFMNMYAGKTSTLSSCCRLRSEAENEYFNMFGSGGTKIGSQGVVTLNLPRYAYLANDQEDFLQLLAHYTELASQINNVKRFILKKRVDNGNLPLYDMGFMSLTRQYSTCGVVGINEALKILGLEITSPQGQEFVLRILKTVNETNEKQQKKTNTPHNMEQVPGESSAVKLAEADRILGYNKEYSLYSNQFIPLTAQADMIDRIRLQGLFDRHMSGGAICHLNIVDRITDRNFMRRLIQTAINKGVIYFAVNYNLQRCENEHMSVGKVENCPTCGSSIVSNFTRVVGFLVDVRNFHVTRRVKDYPVRQFYTDVQQQHAIDAQPEVKKNAVL